MSLFPKIAKSTFEVQNQKEIKISFEQSDITK